MESTENRVCLTPAERKQIQKHLENFNRSTIAGWLCVSRVTLFRWLNGTYRMPESKRNALLSLVKKGKH